MKPHKTKCFNIAWASLYYTISMSDSTSRGVLQPNFRFLLPEPFSALCDCILLYILQSYRVLVRPGRRMLLDLLKGLRKAYLINLRLNLREMAHQDPSR